MDRVEQDESVCLSLGANTLGKGMKPSVLSPAKDKFEYLIRRLVQENENSKQLYDA